MKKAFGFIIICFFTASIVMGQYQTQACVSDDEYRLYKMINQYRNEYGLAAIPLSASLCKVAGAHVWDLEVNQPEGGRCNLHSWSDDGPWTACCYTEDHRNADCVWSKPSELTSYPGEGYEVAYYSSWPNSKHKDLAGAALEGWKSSPGHKHMILNMYNWKRVDWKAMGVGIYHHYVVVWFGDKTDPGGKARKCR